MALNEGLKIVVGMSAGFVIAMGMASKYSPTLTFVGGLSAAMVAWLIADRF